MESELLSIKLTSGEEILGKYKSGDETAWQIEDARSIIMMPDGQLRFGPVLFSGDKNREITIFKTAIAVHSNTVRPEFVEAYAQAVSPLTLPKKNIIMG